MERDIKIIIVVAVAVILVTSAVGLGPFQWYFGTTSQKYSSESTGSMLLFIGQEGEWEIKVDTEPNRSPYQYQWYFGDGTTAPGSNRTTHAFDRGGVFTVTVQITGSGGWSEKSTWTDIQVFAPDSIGVSIDEKGCCDWNSTYMGDLFLNVTVWNNASFDIGFSKYYFGLNNTASGYIEETVNETNTNILLRPGESVTWTLFFRSDQGTPSYLKFLLFSWKVDWNIQSLA